MGMDLETFRHLTPAEFRAVYDSWFSHQRDLMRHDWMVGRYVGALTWQPYSDKPLHPSDLIFPWEKAGDTNAAIPQGASSKEKMDELWNKWKGLKEIKNPPQATNCERPPCETSD